MPVVTKLSQQTKNPDRANVYIDGRYCCSLSLDEVVGRGLKKGDKLTEHEVEQIRKLGLESKAYLLCTIKLLRRPHSEKEIREYLKRKKYDQELIDAVIERLYAYRYLDDKAFAQAWIESRRRSKQRSTRRLYQELLQKGIDRELIGELLDHPQDDEREALRELISRKQRQTRYKDRLRLMQYLTRQGFSYSDVVEALDDGAGE